jgi:hypothetical protein
MQTISARSSIAGQNVVTRRLRGNIDIEAPSGTGTSFTTSFSFENLTTYLFNASRNTLFAAADWRLLKIRATLIPVADNPGITQFMFSEEIIDPTKLPSYWARSCTNTNRDSTNRSITWSSESFDDLAFWPVGKELDPVPVYFYANTTLTSHTANQYFFYVQLDVTLQTRGTAINTSVIPSPTTQSLEATIERQVDQVIASRLRSAIVPSSVTPCASAET